MNYVYTVIIADEDGNRNYFHTDDESEAIDVAKQLGTLNLYSYIKKKELRKKDEIGIIHSLFVKITKEGMDYSFRSDYNDEYIPGNNSYSFDVFGKTNEGYFVCFKCKNSLTYILEYKKDIEKILKHVANTTFKDIDVSVILEMTEYELERYIGLKSEIINLDK